MKTNEVRPIDANALLESGICTEYGYNDNGLLLIPMRDVTNSIQNAPTIDAVPVVRCRECEYWGDEDGKLQSSDGVLFARCKIHNYLLDGRHTGWCPTENDFCSYGERKGGAD